MIKTPDMMYGALKANVDTSGFTVSKALNNFEELLDGDKWKGVGDGFDDINVFLETVDLSNLKFSIEQRKRVSKKLAAKQASQRATAKALGVGQATVTRDLKQDEPHGSHTPKTPIENQEVTNTSEPNETPEPTEEVGDIKLSTANGSLKPKTHKPDNEKSNKQMDLEDMISDVESDKVVTKGKDKTIIDVNPPWPLKEIYRIILNDIKNMDSTSDIFNYFNKTIKFLKNDKFK